MNATDLVPLRLRSALALGLASAVGLAAFFWPFFVDPGTPLESSSHSGDAPFLFVAILPLLAAIVLAELTSGGMDAKAVAMLGMLATVGGALRALGPGVAGLEPSFAVIILGGRVFGRGFGFVLGCLTLFVGALITGGVGPWLPFQMMAAGWVGFLAGCLPQRRGRAAVRRAEGRVEAPDAGEAGGEGDLRQRQRRLVDEGGRPLPTAVAAPVRAAERQRRSYHRQASATAQPLSSSPSMSVAGTLASL